MEKKPEFKDQSLHFINEITNKAIRERATDIHWEPFITEGQKEFVVRFRIDGVLRDVDKVVKSDPQMDSLTNAIKIMSGLDPTKKRREQDGRFTFTTLSGADVDVRVASMPTIIGEKIVMRIMDRSRYCLSLEELGMDKEFVEVYRSVFTRPEGFVIISGPTGSGKTTTLYSTLQQVYSRQENICTIEDPVECKFVGINQIQVEHEFGMTFVSGLRAIMRQDPDIIAVGEIRDGETARTALQAALAGSMVFSTLHGRDAIHTIIRLLDMEVEPYFISSALTGVLAQRLIRLICKICKGKGCSQCMNTGFKKRTGIFELVVINDKMRDLILHKASADELRAAAGNNIVPFQGSIDKLLKENLTTQQEIDRVFAIE
ncbi:MAG: GspE/PulE family protein [Candidatus Omnitrophica bacterium]|nr:GspE/PulE family protein [Candidatus Omnitrophota bacterium]MDD5352823.1 GspE/PulE family protein [Candidatus Omnitrophota bacterium]MDD5550422.1 GspE/PulE family protein [Candidatus Omnitrophota bacterium]